MTRPLTYATFWLNRVTGGSDPLGYHVVNLALHVTAVFLAAKFLTLLLPAGEAFVAALLFAVHPMQAEAVNYVFARAIVLAAVFCFAAGIAWVRDRQWQAVLWFGAALLAKQEVAAFPLFLLFLDWSRGKAAICWRPLGAMLLCSLASGALTFAAIAARPGSGVGAAAALSPLVYLFSQGAVILRYLGQFLVPVGLTVDPELRVPGLLPGMAAWIVLLALAVLAWRQRRSLQPGFWFVSGLLLLLPSSSIFPASDLAADRRMYVPLLAFAVCGAGLLARALPARFRPIAAGCSVAILMIVSMARTSVWRTEESLWSDAVRKAPEKLRPRLQLARALPPQRALLELTAAKKIAPADPSVPSEEGRIYLEMGKPQQALAAFGEALALAPASPAALNNRGVALLALGLKEAARGDFERALARDRCFSSAAENLVRAGGQVPAGKACR